jgi:hypothetical protein
MRERERKKALTQARKPAVTPPKSKSVLDSLVEGFKDVTGVTKVEKNLNKKKK